MEKVLIIGYGIVGKMLYQDLVNLSPDIYDKFDYKYNKKENQKYKIAFICVDTPYSEQNYCDITEVENSILENDAEIYVIKSTILPGTTEKLIKKYNKNIIFSPEFRGITLHNNKGQNYTILGGNKDICSSVIQSLQNCYDCYHQFQITDSKTAELVKYMSNSFLATKVSFCVQFWEIAKKMDVNYEQLRELFVLDSRVNPSHTFVYNDHPYWESHCFDKDLKAISESYNAEFLLSVIEYNDKMKQDNK